METTKELRNIIKSLLNASKDSLTFREISENELSEYIKNNTEDHETALKVKELCNKIYRDYVYYADSYQSRITFYDKDTEFEKRISTKLYIKEVFEYYLKKFKIRH